MKIRVAERFLTLSEDLKAIIKEVWVNKISLELCQKLARSMSQRIAVGLIAKGQLAKY